jgi:H+/Cl- antiporter ClcA
MNWIRQLIKGNKVRTGVLQALPFWIASLVTGVIAVLYTRLFEWAENLGVALYKAHGILIFILAPVGFLLAWLLVKQVDTYASGSGIPQVMAAIELTTPTEDDQVKRLLNLRMMMVKIVSSLFMIFGGGAIGREGPTIQIAGTVFRKINEWLPESWPKISKKNMILTGAAAGLAAAFNTPLGGIVFAVEELAKTHFSHFKTAVFTSVIIAGLTAQAFLGPYLYLGYPVITQSSAYMLLAVIPVALIAGLGGSLMGLVILKILNWKSKLEKRYMEMLFVLFCALAMGIIAYFFNNSILGSGKDEMTQLLFTNGKRISWQVPLVRTLGPLLSFTTGASGGIFAPALSAGATMGAYLAGLFDLSASNTNLLILCGMVACLTGITRSPFTSAILVLEMTDRHNVIFFLMLSAIASSLISGLVSKHSLYEYLKLQYILKLRKEMPVIYRQNDEDTPNIVEPV